MGMKELSQHIIAVAHDKKLPITNLQLQKVMYFVLKEAKENGVLDNEKIKEIYDEEFLVWRYGPVVESVYDRYSYYVANEITEYNEIIDKYNVLNELIEKYLREDVFDLVEKSHQNSFWKENEKHIKYAKSKIKYNIGDI